MNENNIFDTVIIGAGPAGLTAAIYNVRADLKTIVLAGNQPGGQLTITTTVDNYPGFPHGAGGMKLMMDMMEQVKNLGVEIKYGVAKEVRKLETGNEKPEFEIELEDGSKLTTKAVIVATGAQARWLGLPGEKELIGHGISGCATCDGIFFRGKTVAVIGGGDVAAEDAEFLSKFATKVYMIHRRDTLRAQVPQQKLVLNNPKIEMVWNTEVIEIIPKRETGNEKLESIKIKNNVTCEEKILEVEGMFVAIGRDAATGFVKDLVKTTEIGQVITGMHEDYRTMTSLPGIFAAGDCTNVDYRQAIVAAGDGCRAGLDAEKWLKMGGE